MINFTVEETNLLCIYDTGSKQELIENVIEALPFMDEDMREIAKRALLKIDELSEAEYTKINLCVVDEVWKGLSGWHLSREIN